MSTDITETMQRLLVDVEKASGISYADGDMRTMRALERRGLVRYVRGRDAWRTTAAGRKRLTSLQLN